MLTWRLHDPCAALRVGLLRRGSLRRRRRWWLLAQRCHQALQRTQVQLRSSRRRCQRLRLPTPCSTKTQVRFFTHIACMFVRWLFH